MAAAIGTFIFQAITLDIDRLKAFRSIVRGRRRAFLSQISFHVVLRRSHLKLDIQAASKGGLGNELELIMQVY